MARGSTSAAIAYFEEARLICTRLNQIGTEEGLEILMNCGIIQRRYGDKTKAVETFLEARRIREAMGTLDTLGGAKLMTELGQAKSRQAEFSEAVHCLMEALETYKRHGWINTPDGATHLCLIHPVANPSTPLGFIGRAFDVSFMAKCITSHEKI